MPRVVPAPLARFCTHAGVVLFAALAGELVAAEPASFRNDVMAVLSKAGCNQGTCHGNQNGKGGFRLSLRGQSPADDYWSLTRGLGGRRIDRFRPETSLLLLKGTGAVAHGGGKRFAAESPEYDVLRQWIAAGAADDRGQAPRLTSLDVSPRNAIATEPADKVQLAVTAEFADGTRRDVTGMACYETVGGAIVVTPGGLIRREAAGEATVLVRFLDQQRTIRVAFVADRPGFRWPDVPEQNEIDRLVFAKLRRLKIAPSPVVDDATFMRRAYLDLCGTLPTPAEARAFLADPDERKRARLVDELLGRPEFADFWALKWSDLMRNEERTLDRKGVQNFHEWFRRVWAENWPMDRLARELVAARGSTYTVPAANFYRANRDPVSRAEAAAQVFLGVRLQCAKCHNHPFDRWTQDDYYSWAAVFDGIDYKIISLLRRDKNDGHEFDGEQIVYLTSKRKVENVATGELAEPRFLGGGEVHSLPRRLDELGEWLTSRDNRMFARTQVNRIWFHLLGRGIVDPIDDFRASNPPANAELLEWLTDEFVGHGFDARHVIRLVMQSSVYQLSATPTETNLADETNFARAYVRPLQAEVLLDAIVQVTGADARFNGYPAGTRAIQLSGVRAVRERDARPTAFETFLEQFGKPPRLLTCECERAGEPTLRQAFQLISGPVMSEAVASRDNRIDALLKQFPDNHSLVAELFTSALGRSPHDAERQAAAAHITGAKDRRAAVEDVLWGLLNSKEFLLRH